MSNHSNRAVRHIVLNEDGHPTLDITVGEVKPNAAVTLEKLDAGWTISKIHLDVAARIPGISEAAFDSAAASAKANCPVSRLFKAEITLNAVLEKAA